MIALKLERLPPAAAGASLPAKLRMLVVGGLFCAGLVLAGQGAARRAALTLARKRRFGPFGPGELDRALREKQIAAMLRAGHPLDSARELVDARSVEAAEDWAAQAREDDACE